MSVRAVRAAAWLGLACTLAACFGGSAAISGSGKLQAKTESYDGLPKTTFAARRATPQSVSVTSKSSMATVAVGNITSPATRGMTADLPDQCCTGSEANPMGCCGTSCCENSTYCNVLNGACGYSCLAGETDCGDGSCCPAHTACVQGQCVPKCVTGLVDCGNGYCCAKGTTCSLNEIGTCDSTVCPGNDVDCGDDTCCPEGTTCSGGFCEKPGECQSDEQDCGDGYCCSDTSHCTDDHRCEPDECTYGNQDCDGKCCNGADQCGDDGKCQRTTCPDNADDCHDGTCCPSGTMCGKTGCMPEDGLSSPNPPTFSVRDAGSSDERGSGGGAK
ncbi:MAG TPA: hypothetical protein VHM19_20640 [Polyangiales bacterium]|nr:hypothetical protein [Polyangiales bacterium]